MHCITAVIVEKILLVSDTHYTTHEPYAVVEELFLYLEIKCRILDIKLYTFFILAAVCNLAYCAKNISGLFSSTYISEATYSQLKIIQSKYRFRR